MSAPITYCATVWVTGGRIPDGHVERRIVTLAAYSPGDFRAAVDARFAKEYGATVARDIQKTFGPIGQAWSEQR